MPIVTAIKQQKKQNRVNVYLDGKFGFGIDLDNFVKCGLRLEKELTSEEIEAIVKKAEFQKTYEKVLRFAMVRPRSEKEVVSWLKRKKVHESIYQGLFDKLKHLELLDDLKFASWWVEQRLAFRPKGKRVLKQELLVKGVAREVIDEVLGEAPIDEKKLAHDLLVKKIPRWKGLPKEDVREKATAFLARQGFDWGVIRSAIDETREKS
jgi:regulatory protein